MMTFYAQMSDGSTLKHQADRMEIKDDAILVYDGDKLVVYADLGATLYAHIYEGK